MARNTGAIIKRHNMLKKIFNFYVIFATNVGDLNFENQGSVHLLSRNTHVKLHINFPEVLATSQP